MNRHTPKHLKTDGAAFWKDILHGYKFDSEADYKLLQAACECLDTIAEAQQAILEHGAYFMNRHGEVKPHPAHAVIRDQKGLFARVIKALGLNEDQTKTPPKTYRRSY